MSDETTHSIEFLCFKCKKKSSYPHEMKEGEANKGATILTKRCTTCGIENTIELPVGWVATKTDLVLRGGKKS